MQEIKLLLCYPSPRDIDMVLRASEELPCDRLFAKYMEPTEAYATLQREFLKRTEYTHMVICPDDLVIQPHNVKRLLARLQEYDYPVLTGVCNIDITDMDMLAIAKNLPSMRTLEGQRHYDWYDRRIDYDPKQPIQKVLFAGFPMQAIRRDVVEKIKLEGDGQYNDNGPAQAFDVVFANRAADLGIPIYADLSNFMLHLRYGGTIKVGTGTIPDVLFYLHKENLLTT